MDNKTTLIGFFQGYPGVFLSNWSAALGEKRFLAKVLLTAMALIPLYLYLVPYLQFIEHRPGIVLNDVILDQLEPRDLSAWIFAIQYLSAGVIICYFLRKPWLFLQGLQIFIVLQYLRNLCLYFIPLGPPEGIIPLHDPILEIIAYQNKPLLQDLFFSGHTASCVVFVLLTRKNDYLFIGFILIALIMICLLLVQHCHYSIDILGGILFAAIAFQIVLQIWRKFDLPGT